MDCNPVLHIIITQYNSSCNYWNLICGRRISLHSSNANKAPSQSVTEATIGCKNNLSDVCSCSVTAPLLSHTYTTNSRWWCFVIQRIFLKWLWIVFHWDLEKARSDISEVQLSTINGHVKSKVSTTGRITLKRYPL